MNDVGIALLAGGRATRLPRKLERPVAGRSLIERAYESAIETGWPVYVVGNAPYLPALPSSARIVPDVTPGGGPLQALVAACTALSQARIIALAADEPLLYAAFLGDLAAAWVDGDEAVVPQHPGGVEPLAAIYDRTAVLRESGATAANGGSMHALLARLRVRYIAARRDAFANVNTPADYERVQREFA
jgi:molybdopterin-guanine dinucleotide biosynthesis protein A